MEIRKLNNTNTKLLKAALKYIYYLDVNHYGCTQTTFDIIEQVIWAVIEGSPIKADELRKEFQRLTNL